MAKMKVYCEPFCIEKGYNFEIHHVSYAESDPYSCFMHFHEVHEIIVFDEIEGSYFYSQGESQLIDNDIVFTPTLETHDFELSDKKKSWYIVQFLPDFFKQNGLEKEASFFLQGMHLRLPAKHLLEVKQQVEWLKKSYDENPHSLKSNTLLKLLLIWLADYAEPVKPPHTQPIALTQSYERLSPVIELFKHQQSVDLSLSQVAEMCHLSPSYFSRLFKSIFRCNYSEYVIRHKLYSAARLLSQSGFSITDISFELHFSSPSHFISLFKKQFGVTPKKYKTELQTRNNNQK
ncbi:AraC family transcriptional regulator [Algibacillus agarilyticus]|uniref:AraC family transcriptional regulator n=1 Tax=Algibacillus agarilyticus TaxID=2234133 RepID=UPI000DD01082|nr:AraC family transcriptional regulator [Algibacillus agarilyticus]